MAYLRKLLLILFTLAGSLPVVSTAGTAYVDANLLPQDHNYDYVPFFALVSWNEQFLVDRPGTKNEWINVTFQSRWGNDESVPKHSKMEGPLNQQTATAMVYKMLNSWPWSPTWVSPPPWPTPRMFTIKFEGSGGAYFSLFVEVVKWKNVAPPLPARHSLEISPSGRY